MGTESENHGFYTFLEMPDTERYPWTKMFDLDEIRYALSGAELVKKGRGLSLFLWSGFFDVYFFNTVFIHLFHTEQYIIICNNDLNFFPEDDLISRSGNRRWCHNRRIQNQDQAFHTNLPDL